MLYQFQCMKEGSLFYYQGQNDALSIVEFCPICGHGRVRATGRTFPDVEAHRPLPIQKDAEDDGEDS